MTTNRPVIVFVLLQMLLIACKESERTGPTMETGADFRKESSTLALTATQQVQCDVIVAGGSTAALAAALTAAREGQSTCLIEPTDWVGGQLTAGGVPAVDYAWHKVDTLDVGSIGKDPANLPKEFHNWMTAIGNPGDCWVSKNCFEPKNLLSQSIHPAISALPKLKVLKNSVVKSVQTETSGGSKRIISLTIIQRTPQLDLPWGGYDKRLSQDIQDWYSPLDSSRYTKQLIQLKSIRAQGPVVIDATEFGEILALSSASYTQGAETTDGDPETSVTQCGQSINFPFVMTLQSSATADNIPPVTVDHPEFYSLNGFSWDRVFTYRRVKGAGGIASLDLSLQNWNPGNDWPFGYIFKSPEDTHLELSDWQGGVDPAAIDKAERHALGWARWYKDNAPSTYRSRLNMNFGVLGTGHGLSKIPYIRDTRRSIGIDNFVLYLGDLQGPSSVKTGKRFVDRIAVGAYNVDVHGMPGCVYPQYRSETLPFYIPARALTNATVINLLVAGKTIAQSFLANAATRLHPIEFASGIGAGSAASLMIQKSLNSSREMIQQYAAVQTIVKKYAPIDITIAGVKYPAPGELLEPLPQQNISTFCPSGSRADLQLGYCVGSLDAYGPFTQAMVKDCKTYGGGPACDATQTFLIDGRQVKIPRWERTFAQGLRGTGLCMKGSLRDSVYTTKCVESASTSASGIKEIYGPFESWVLTQCLAANGGDACYSNRWSYSFYDSLMKQLP